MCHVQPFLPGGLKHYIVNNYAIMPYFQWYILKKSWHSFRSQCHGLMCTGPNSNVTVFNILMNLILFTWEKLCCIHYQTPCSMNIHFLLFMNNISVFWVNAICQKCWRIPFRIRFIFIWIINYVRQLWFSKSTNS